MIKVQNQERFKQAPIIVAEGEFKYATKEEGKKNWTETAQDVLNSGADIFKTGKETFEDIRDQGVDINGTNIKLGKQEENKEKKILGIPKPIFIAGTVIVGVAGAIILVKAFSGKKGKKAAI